jgi:hypothetical protein
MLVNSIDPLAPYKVSDDLILELVNVNALIKIDPEGVAAAASWIEVIEPHNLGCSSTSRRTSARQSAGSNDLRQKRRR